MYDPQILYSVLEYILPLKILASPHAPRSNEIAQIVAIMRASVRTDYESIDYELELVNCLPRSIY